jgi:hypothetical protein
MPSGGRETVRAMERRILGVRWVALHLAGPGVPTVDRSKRSLKLVRNL